MHSSLRRCESFTWNTNILNGKSRITKMVEAVQHRTGITEVTGSKPIEDLNLSAFICLIT